MLQRAAAAVLGLASGLLAFAAVFAVAHSIDPRFLAVTSLVTLLLIVSLTIRALRPVDARMSSAS